MGVKSTGIRIDNSIESVFKTASDASKAISIVSDCPTSALPCCRNGLIFIPNLLIFLLAQCACSLLPKRRIRFLCSKRTQIVEKSFKKGPTTTRLV